MSTRSQIRIFKTVATAEALSWAGLLVGMYLKYLTDAGELGVKIFGPIHGGIFLAYVVVTLVVSRTLRWSVWTTLVAMACSIPPFATALFEVVALRSELLEPRADGRPADGHPADESTGLPTGESTSQPING